MLVAVEVERAEEGPLRLAPVEAVVAILVEGAGIACRRRGARGRRPGRCAPRA
jgi:hypothetical protein